jgi:hypothetical protein
MLNLQAPRPPSAYLDASNSNPANRQPATSRRRRRRWPVAMAYSNLATRQCSAQQPPAPSPPPPPGPPARRRPRPPPTAQTPTAHRPPPPPPPPPPLATGHHHWPPPPPTTHRVPCTMPTGRQCREERCNTAGLWIAALLGRWIVCLLLVPLHAAQLLLVSCCQQRFYKLVLYRSNSRHR